MFAEENYPDKTERFQVNLSANSIERSLEKLAEIYNIAFIADASTISGLQHSTIQGHFTLLQLLNKLFADNDVSVQITQSGVILRPIVQIPLVAQKKTKPSIEEIIISGKRQSNAISSFANASHNNMKNALNKQRESIAFADDIGYAGLTALPTNNLAESFQYLSGVNISRDYGEGLAISSRGLGPDYHATTLNGHLLAINENVRNSGQSGRVFRFDVLSAANIGRVNIAKNGDVTNLVSGLGTAINIQTIQPLNLGNRKLVGEIALDYTHRSAGYSPKINVLSSWVNKQNNMGIALSAGFNERKIQQQTLQTWEWDTNGNSYWLPTLDSDVLLPSNRMAITLESEQRRNMNIGIAGQWQVSPNTLLGAEYYQYHLTSEFNEQRLLARLDSAEQLITSSVKNDILVAAEFSNIEVKSALETSTQQHINAISILNLDTRLDQWRLQSSIAFTRATSITDSPIRRTRLLSNSRSFSYDMGNHKRAKTHIYFEDFPRLQTDFSALEHVSARMIDVLDKGNAWRLNIARQYPSQFISASRFGFNWRKQHRGYQRQDLKVNKSRLTQYSTQYNWVDEFAGNDFLTDYLQQPPSAGWAVPSSDIQSYYSDDLIFGELTDKDKRNSYRIVDEVSTLFSQIDFSAKKIANIEGQLGARWYHWNNQIESIFQWSPQGNFTEARSKRYAYLLPDFKLKLSLSQAIQLKFSAAKSLSLPSYTDLNPRLTVNSTDGVLLASAGNPDLQPIEGYQWDLGGYWYYADNANVYAEYFKKRLYGIISLQSFEQEIDGVVYHLSQPINGADTWVTGWELGANSSFMNGFGYQAKLTLAHSKTRSTSQVQAKQYNLEGVSPLGINLHVFYEAEPWFMRLGYSYREHYLEALSTTDAPDTWVDDTHALQLLLGYQINEHCNISLHGNNLLARPLRRYLNANEQDSLSSIHHIDRSWSMSVKFDW